jgi:hypothetical protein
MAGSLVSELWGWIGGFEEDFVWGRLCEFCDPMGVVCARYQLRMLSARLHAAASDSDGVRSGVDLCSPGRRGLGLSRGQGGFLGYASGLLGCRVVG